MTSHCKYIATRSSFFLCLSLSLSFSLCFFFYLILICLSVSSCFLFFSLFLSVYFVCHCPSPVCLLFVSATLESPRHGQAAHTAVVPITPMLNNAQSCCLAVLPCRTLPSPSDMHFRRFLAFPSYKSNNVIRQNSFLGLNHFLITQNTRLRRLICFQTFF